MREVRPEIQSDFFQSYVIDGRRMLFYLFCSVLRKRMLLQRLNMYVEEQDVGSGSGRNNHRLPALHDEAVCMVGAQVRTCRRSMRGGRQGLSTRCI